MGEAHPSNLDRQHRHHHWQSGTPNYDVAFDAYWGLELSRGPKRSINRQQIALMVLFLHVIFNLMVFNLGWNGWV